MQGAEAPYVMIALDLNLMPRTSSDKGATPSCDS